MPPLSRCSLPPDEPLPENMSPAAGPRDRIRGLYAVTPDVQDTAMLLEKCQAAIAGGAACQQYRNKAASRWLAREQAAVLKEACDAVCFIVNDDVELAIEIGADGVHLGRDDLSGNLKARMAETRAEAPAGFVIGISCYDDFAIALAAAGAGADYIAFGSFHPSSTKPLARRASLDLLRRAKDELRVPVVAIGGITLDNAEELVAAGADALAVISSLFGAVDVQATARAFSGLYDPNH